MKIDTICDALLDALAEVGFHENTIFNYKGVIRRFKTFCDENAVDTYTPVVGKLYAEDVVSKKTGQFSMNRYHSQGRFIRLLDLFTGYFIVNRKCRHPSRLP